MPQHSYTESTLEVADGVAVFTMNRPDTRNAFTREMRRDLCQLARDVRADDAVKVLILTGAGGFSAGGDVKAMNEGFASPAAARQLMLEHHEFLEPLMNLELPVIAAVHGAVFGGGFSLALACDFILATPKAKFCAVFGRIGVIPDMAIMHTLPRMVGLQRAKEICYTARVVAAEEARDLGLIYAIVPEDQLMAEAKALADRLKVGSKLSIGLSKLILNRSFETDYKALANDEATAQAVCLMSDYHKEQAARFAAKQPLPYDWERLSKRAAE
jgi:2-(1,2-epoxy-1,2-dihydrophenyl)acetyl-CoA isomerase